MLSPEPVCPPVKQFEHVLVVERVDPFPALQSDADQPRFLKLT